MKCINRFLTEWGGGTNITPRNAKEVHEETDNITMGKVVNDNDVALMPYLQAMMKEI